MEKRIITEILLESFEQSLYNDEKSKATIVILNEKGDKRGADIKKMPLRDWKN